MDLATTEISAVPSHRSHTPASLIAAASLSTAELFKGLPAACLHALEQGSELREFRSGHVFFRTGEKGERLFLLEKGQVRTFRTPGTRKLIVAELEPPAISGAVGWLDLRGALAFLSVHLRHHEFQIRRIAAALIPETNARRKNV